MGEGIVEGEVTGLDQLQKLIEILGRVERKLLSIGGSLGFGLQDNTMYLSPFGDEGNFLAKKIYEYNQGEANIEAVEFIVDKIVTELRELGNGNGGGR